MCLVSTLGLLCFGVCCQVAAVFYSRRCAIVVKQHLVYLLHIGLNYYVGLNYSMELFNKYV